MIRAFALLVAVCAMAVVVYRTTSDRAGESAGARTRLIWGSVLGTATGAVLAFWAPSRVPQTDGSPATIVMMLILWIIGGGLIFVGLASLPAAVRARPSAEAHRYEP